MSYEKVVEAEVWGFTQQISDIRIGAGYSSGGTFTGKANPLRGALVWDRCMAVLQGVSVTGQTPTTGGSYSVWLHTDAVEGYTALPVALAANLGPNTPSTVIMRNVHYSPGMPLPTHCYIDKTANGDDGLTFTLHILAKQYRGAAGAAGAKNTERVIQGTMFRGASFAGGYCTSGKGMDSSETITLGTSSSSLGMHRMRLWDNVFYWAVAGASVAGTHDVDIIGEIGGATFGIARTSAVGAINTAWEKNYLESDFFGQSPNPTAIIWTEATAGGVSDARVVCVAKGGRGSMGKY